MPEIEDNSAWDLEMNASLLIIDDDPGMTDLLSGALKHLGFEVAVANTGEDGIRMIKRAPPQIVVLDLIMPGMDGWQTCEAIRRFSSLPILVLSPLDKPAVVASILDAGADDCMLQPVSLSLLVGRLKKITRRASAMGPLSQRRVGDPDPVQRALLGVAVES